MKQAVASQILKEDTSMKKTVGMIMIGALLTNMAATAGDREKKNEPKSRTAVSEAVSAAGAKHFPEKMKIRSVGSIKMENTYYHVYCGILKGGYEYHVILFDNKPEYLGYYLTEFEPTGTENGKKEGAVLIDLEDGNEASIRIRQIKGPADMATIDGVKSYFVKAPEKKKVSTLVTKAKEDKGVVKPEFRKWTITKESKKHTVRAIYVSQDFGKVTVRAEASGREVTVPKSMISKEDREYIKQFE